MLSEGNPEVRLNGVAEVAHSGIVRNLNSLRSFPGFPDQPRENFYFF